MNSPASVCCCRSLSRYGHVTGFNGFWIGFPELTLEVVDPEWIPDGGFRGSYIVRRSPPFYATGWIGENGLLKYARQRLPEVPASRATPEWPIGLVPGVAVPNRPLARVCVITLMS